jgi:hypothetical protein
MIAPIRGLKPTAKFIAPIRGLKPTAKFIKPLRGRVMNDRADPWVETYG